MEWEVAGRPTPLRAVASFIFIRGVVIFQRITWAAVRLFTKVPQNDAAGADIHFWLITNKVLLRLASSLLRHLTRRRG